MKDANDLHPVSFMREKDQVSAVTGYAQPRCQIIPDRKGGGTDSHLTDNHRLDLGDEGMRSLWIVLCDEVADFDQVGLRGRTNEQRHIQFFAA